MTRMRMTHNYHEATSLNPETFCTKCGQSTPHLCEWCGECKACHTGARAEKSY